MGNSQTSKLSANLSNMEVYAPIAVADVRSLPSASYGLCYYLQRLVTVTAKPRNRLPLIKAGIIEALIEKLADERSTIYARPWIFCCLLNLSLHNDGKQVIINKGLEEVIEDHSGCSNLMPNGGDLEISVVASRILESCHRYKYKLSNPILPYHKE